MATNLPFVLSVAVAAAVLIVILVVVRRARHVEQRQVEADAALLGASDNRLRDMAARNHWQCDIHPSEVLWYRISGMSSNGIQWEIVEGKPTLVEGSVIGPGARWSSNDIQISKLMAELMPATLFERMRRALSTNTWDNAWSAATRKLIEHGRVVPVPEVLAAQRLLLVAAAPKAADRLFSTDVANALAALQSYALHVSVGFPNLRIACDEGGSRPEFLPLLVAAGSVTAQRLRSHPFLEEV